MKKFLDSNFLLSTVTAENLYHRYAENMPIIDYHCHINPREIYEDRKFSNITQVWLGEDHYKWRLMRSNGIEERYITGDASDYDKFISWVKTLQLAIGSPLYHWSHLELKKYFGYEGYLTEETADDVWNLCNAQLSSGTCSVRSLIEKSNVTVICTTDDPLDSLEWHQKLASDSSFLVQVRPTWRPDKAMNIEKSEYVNYIKKLGAKNGLLIHTFDDLIHNLSMRMDFFQSIGCIVSDHGLEHIMYAPTEPTEIETIFKKRMQGIIPSYEETLKFKTAFLIEMGREYHRRNWVMQLHYGCKRDNNTVKYQELGPDTGYDCIYNYTSSAQITDFLNELNTKEQLPKVILYSLNPNDNSTIDTILGCFQDDSAIGKIQHGSAWWFNDHKTGMIEQMTSLANLGLLSNFIGMLTDSRSFLSYTRHEYFRRILCDLLGKWVENGEYPNDDILLERIIKGIAYNNAVQYFNFS